MRSNGLPDEFEGLLSRAGKRVLAGTHPLCGALADPRRRFLISADLLDRARVERLRRLLEKELAATLESLQPPVPPESISEVSEGFAGPLPTPPRPRPHF